MSQAARPPEAREFGLAWPGEPTGLAGLAFWLQAGPGTTLHVEFYRRSASKLKMNPSDETRTSEQDTNITINVTSTPLQEGNQPRFGSTRPASTLVPPEEGSSSRRPASAFNTSTLPSFATSTPYGGSYKSRHSGSAERTPTVPGAMPSFGEASEGQLPPFVTDRKGKNRASQEQSFARTACGRVDNSAAERAA